MNNPTTHPLSQSAALCLAPLWQVAVVSSCWGSRTIRWRSGRKKIMKSWLLWTIPKNFCAFRVYPSFVLSLNLSSVFKFNLSRAKQSLPKISTKFLSVCPSVCPSVRPENQTLFRWRNFFWGNRKTHQKINRHNDCALLTAPAGGERSEPTAGARGVGELKRIPSRRS